MELGAVNPIIYERQPIEVFATEPPEPRNVGGALDSFTRFVERSLDTVNAQQVQGDRVVQDFLMGADIPVHSVMMEMSKADTSMRLASGVVQRVIEAYNEISRMQI
jgi:flagellar hook-basal body complex protein FliE